MSLLPVPSSAQDLLGQRRRGSRSIPVERLLEPIEGGVGALAGSSCRRGELVVCGVTKNFLQIL